MNNRYIHKLAQKYEIILGSGSPRRLQLLTETGIKFKQIIPDLEETQLDNEPPYQYAERLAQDKALYIAQNIDDNQLVLGCDTIVVLNGKVLGKPQSTSEAFTILKTLSGHKHIVCTALAFAKKNKIITSGYELTDVYFNHVQDEQINEYIITGEPMDKAGAYGIQGMGAFLVDRIEGNLDNVIGFPRELLKGLTHQILINDTQN